VAADPKDVRRRPAARSSRGRPAHAQKRARRARERHEQFELVQEALGIVTWIWEPQADLVRWYGDASRLLGLPPGRFSGRYADYLAQVHPEDLEKAKRTFVDCMQGRYPEYRAEERVVWPDGSVHWLETYGRAEYGADGRAIRMAGVVKDISVAKREESARLRAERLLAHVFDASPEYITVVRARDGAFVAANAAFERVTGFRAAEIVGRTVDELELWGDAAERDRFRADLQRDGAVHERPTMLRLRDGTVISGMLSASLVEHAGERLVVSVVHDVSEARLLQRRAQQSERKFATVFMTSPDPVAISRVRDGVHLDVNDAWVRATGHARQDAVGRSSHELGLWQDPAARREVLAQLDTAGAVHGLPARFVRANGEVFPALVSGAKVTLDGEACVVWAWRDIGELSSALGQARQAERMFSALFESSPEPITLYRISDGMRLAANGAWERLSGFRREQAVGRPVDDTKMWHDDAQGNAVLARLEAEGSVSNVEAQLKRADGAVFDALISGVRLELDGEPCILWSWRDTSELKRLEQRARHGERMFAALFESSPEPITLYRIADGMRLAANSAWERATGHRREAATGRPAVSVTLFRDPLQRAALVERATAEGGISNAEARLMRADGTEFDALISAARVDVEGEPCLLWTWHDMSQLKRLEQQAQQSARKFASMFETSPVALVVSRAAPGRGIDDRIVEINDAALSLIGAKREEAIGVPASRLVTWVEPLAIEDLRWRALAGERILGAPARFDRHDGKRVEVLLSGVQLEIGGEPHFVVSLYDVTERNRMQRERENADASYRALFATAMDGIVILSPQWTFVDLNPAACAFMGYERGELLGKSVTTVFGPEELERNPIRPERQWTQVERFLTRKDGTRRAIEVQAGPMPDGNILVIARDISERKRHEAMLMNVARGVSAEVGDAFFQSLVEHLARELEADFAFIAKLTYPDRERLRTLAFVADGANAPNFEYAVAGSPCATGLERRGTVIYPAGVAEQFPQDAGLKRLGVQGYIGTSLHSADGSAIGVLVVMHRRPIERAQLWSSMIEIFGARAAAEIERARAERLVRRTNESLEQTVRERTAELEDANRDLESFNYSISHDLRQPLSAIAGFAELLRDAGADTTSRRRQEFVREIEANAERMEGMISTLMQLARAGRGPLEKTQVDMRALVDSVLRELGASAPLEGIVEVADLPPVLGDAVLLRQVWSNLIGNALKYSREQAAPRVRIRGARVGDGIEYAVSDNGVGFDMRHAGRLFEAFQRLPSAASYEGSGVGLAIVQRIVRRHGGRLTPESAPGQGATFRFTLPA
jgi:PAS domain S-box-containing protein